MLAALGIGRWILLASGAALLGFAILLREDEPGVRLGLTAGGVALVAWGAAAVRAHARAERIQRLGIRATGLIHAMRQTGTVVNNEPAHRVRRAGAPL